MQLMPPRLLEQVSDASNYMFVWLLVKKHVMYIARGVVVSSCYHIQQIVNLHQSRQSLTHKAESI